MLRGSQEQGAPPLLVAARALALCARKRVRAALRLRQGERLQDCLCRPPRAPDNQWD